MNTQHKPATPLPWTAVSDYYPETGRDEQFSPYIVGGAEKTNVAAAMMQPRERDFLANRAYLAHAANAYPQLVEALRICASLIHPDGKPVCGEKVRALLRSLGEAE